MYPLKERVVNVNDKTKAKKAKCCQYTPNLFDVHSFMCSVYVEQSLFCSSFPFDFVPLCHAIQFCNFFDISIEHKLKMNE